MALPKVKKGDVFSIELTQGFGLIQCVEESSGDEVEFYRALPGSYDKIEDAMLDELVRQKELFFSNMPMRYALKNKDISFLGNSEIPEGSEVPKYFRTKHVVRSNYLGWHIVDRFTLNRRLVENLSTEEQSLSGWGSISIPDLVERIENNWTPMEWT